MLQDAAKTADWTAFDKAELEREREAAGCLSGCSIMYGRSAPWLASWPYLEFMPRLQQHVWDARLRVHHRSKYLHRPRQAAPLGSDKP